MDLTIYLSSLNIFRYSAAADIATVAISLMNWLLITTTYTKKQQNLKLFHIANGMVMLAACFSMLSHHRMFLQKVGGNTAYLLHSIMYITLAIVYIFYFFYIRNLIGFSNKYKLHFDALIFIPFIIFCILKITSPSTGLFFFNLENEISHNLLRGFINEPFRLLYVYDNLLMGIILFTYRRKFITKMLQCIFESCVLAYTLIIIQDIFKQTSFTCLTFIFPIEAVLFLYHYSSYDIETGTLDNQAFDAYIKDWYGSELTFVSLTLDKLEQQNMAGALSSQFYHFNEKYFKDNITFKVKSDCMIMILKDYKNPNCQEKIEEMLQDFRELYNEFILDFKIVIFHSEERLKNGRLYVRLDDFIKRQMEWNTVKYVKREDLDKFFKNLEIVESLKDIKASNDMYDKRVKVFCQPILDTDTKKYITAEALMRIELDDMGMIYPDVFIPMLENNEMIHDFTLIILNKTCHEIAKLVEEGYDIERVTINISMQELKNRNLCEEITSIIEKHKIPYSMIGIELTESLNELDYENTKYAINEWKKYNMKIYLDDFGTGYSNISRILQLPFDVIKFDRSLTQEAGGSDQSHFIVENFAKIFKRAKYNVLFEGVENIDDEERCIKMGADMLQGYSYSRPIPIENIRSFLDKK